MKKKSSESKSIDKILTVDKPAEQTAVQGKITTYKKIVSHGKPKIEKHVIDINISPDKYFVLKDGRQLKDYRELASALDSLNDDVFNFHVNKDRNDFSNWINDVFQEHELAEHIRHIHNRFEMQAKLYKHLFEKAHKLVK